MTNLLFFQGAGAKTFGAETFIGRCDADSLDEARRQLRSILTTPAFVGGLPVYLDSGEYQIVDASDMSILERGTVKVSYRYDDDGDTMVMTGVSLEIA